MDGPVRLDPERLLAVGSSELYDAVSVTGAHELEDGVTVEVSYFNILPRIFCCSPFFHLIISSTGGHCRTQNVCI